MSCGQSQWSEMTSGSSTRLLPGAGADLQPAGSGGCDRDRAASAPSGPSAPRAGTARFPRRGLCDYPGYRRIGAEGHAALLVEPREPYQRAMKVNGFIVARAPEFGDQPLRLAKRIAPHRVAAFGENASEASSFSISWRGSGWQNTGRPNVASVTNTSQATGSNARAVGSGVRL